jgi:hypothetical protein
MKPLRYIIVLYHQHVDTFIFIRNILFFNFSARIYLAVNLSRERGGLLMMKKMLEECYLTILITTVDNNQHLSGPMRGLGSRYKRTWESSRSRSGDARSMAARIVFTVSVFGNCNLMCKYRVSRRNDLVCACTRALAVEIHTLYRPTDSRVRLCFCLFFSTYHVLCSGLKWI